MRFGAFAACVAAAPLLMGAAEPARLKPSSPWNVDYAENSCRLSRAFGEGDSKVVLSLESEAPGAIDMFVVGKQVRATSSAVTGRFLPVQQKPMMGRSAQSNYGSAVLWSQVSMLPDEVVEKERKKSEERYRRAPRVRPPAIDLAEKAAIDAQHREFAAKIRMLEVDSRGRPLILETGSMGEAVKAFDKCSRDSLRDWGLDPDVDDKIVRRPWAADVWNWFSANDYPSAMYRKGQQADVKVRLMVDATGKITKCTSLSHFKEKSFNDVVCAKFMERGRFEPAELADGTKVPSYYVRHVIFLMAGR